MAAFMRTLLHHPGHRRVGLHNDHPLDDQTLATVRWEPQQLAITIGAPVPRCAATTPSPWDEIYIDNIPIFTPNKLLALLRSLTAHMDDVG